jgi:hypothetical protein
MRYNVGAGTFILTLLFALFLVVVIPFITIWSFNTLFGMGIEYTAWTWLAMFWLQATLAGSVGAAIRSNRD